MSTVALIPVKRFTHAKQRLARNIGRQIAKELAQSMLADVLEQVSKVNELEEIVLITQDEEAAEIARSNNFNVLCEFLDVDHSSAVKYGLDWLTDKSINRTLVISADCPAVSAEEISDLLTSSIPIYSGVIVSNQQREGTNALLLTPPSLIEPSFGPGSLARHVGRLKANGVTPLVVSSPGLEIDIDTRKDIVALLQYVTDKPDLARRTRMVITRYSLGEKNEIISENLDYVHG